MMAEDVAQVDDVDVEDDTSTPSDQALTSVASLAKEMKEVTDEIAVIEAQLKLKQDRLRAISESELPTAVLSTGLIAVPLADGTMIEVITAYHSGISEANRPAAHEWLRGNGFADYIKREIKVQFGRGEEALADTARSYLYTTFPQHKVDDKEAVNASSLKALVNREMEAGNPKGMPEDLFSIHTRRYAEITDTTTKQLKRGRKSKDEF